MKKVNMLMALSASAMILGGAVSANAAVIKEELERKDDMKFEITTQGEGTVKDPDPIKDGGEPEDKTTGPLIPFKGDLAITAIPQLNFGKIELGGKSATAYQDLFMSKPYKYEDGKGAVIDESKEEKKYKPGVRVDDVRGTNEGWTLFASLGEIKGAKEKNILKGAQLKFPSVTISTNNVHAALPADSNGDIHGQASLEATLASDDASHKLMEAAKGTGRGGNQATYFFGIKDDTQPEGYKPDQTKQISLTVPAGSLVDTYTGTVTYKLTETPADKPAE
ncbi:MAG: WxL domain-containing protein [Vagococcus sp.]|uniref:WxL domain-containing protein n=1 Tax=Vagococcus sp. TaxID=1933889 RepID=UPI002FCA74AA